FDIQTPNLVQHYNNFLSFINNYLIFTKIIIMRKLNLLRSLIDIFLLFGLISIITMLLFVPMYLFSADFDIPIVINGQTIEETRWSAKVVAIFAGLGGILFFYGIFLLRKILILFQQRQIFVDSIVQNFYRIGYCVIGSGLLTN